MTKVLITGAGSYVGGSFAEYARKHYATEFEIDTIDMKQESWKDYSFSGYDCIFHVAGIAHADVGKVSEDVKAQYYRVNTELAIETAAKAKAEGVRQFVLMSSMIVYGGMEHISKETEPKPANFYGDSKWQADKGVRALGTEEFLVTVLRPPMIYGKGSKGNYPTLAKLARKLPVFPKVHNKRSMLYIENLCEFLCIIMKEQLPGIYFPQNKEPVNTSDMVAEIAKVSGHKLWITSVLTPFVVIGKKMPGKIGDLLQKAFGSSYYAREMGETGFDYCKYDLSESIWLTEGKT